ncbi:MAG: DUF4065 domain-containing protein [Tannerellaceae bacterium]|jgi:uncharacterized phage-associated protein|nr:DUF4065 domain-containing protein [Tannerellaceae bacterium]
MNANQISDYVISLTQNNIEENLTNLKLQKILYYLQGYYLAIYNEKLFDDEIESWRYGPVVSEVYHAYKSYGNYPIVLPDVEMNFDYLSSSQKKFINKVYAYFRQFSAIKLMDMTHDELPWKTTYGKGIPIPEELLCDFFRKSEIKDHFIFSDKKKERKDAAQFLLADYIHDTNLIESTILDAEDIYEY